MAHLVQTMFSANRITPWHGLGNIIEEAPDSQVAIKVAGLDWEVRKRHIYVEGKIVDGYKANVREDTGDVLGIVTDRYQIVQNYEAFAFTDALISGGDVRYETAGSLRDGKQIWLLAKMNKEYDILGDKFDPYLCFTNTHDGSGAVRALMTPIRVVCANTLNLAMSRTNRAWGSKHVGDVNAKLNEAQRTLGLATQYMDRLNEEANFLVDIKLNNNKMNEIINELLPINAKDSDRKIANMKEKRDGLMRAMKADDIKRFNGTAWHLMNAVTDFVDHPADLGRKTKDSHFQNLVNGDELMDKTYLLLKQVA